MPRPPISDEVITKVTQAYEELFREKGGRPPPAVEVYKKIGGEEQHEIGSRKVQQLVSGFKNKGSTSIAEIIQDAVRRTHWRTRRSRQSETASWRPYAL